MTTISNSCKFGSRLDSTAVSIFVDILVELKNAAFVNSTNMSANIETAVLSIDEMNNQKTLPKSQQTQGLSAFTRVTTFRPF